jgi:Xaa-Pro aminopeptidase
MKAIAILLLVCGAAAAQPAPKMPPRPPKKDVPIDPYADPAPKKDEPKKDEPKDAKKADPKKADPKKDAKKDEPKDAKKGPDAEPVDPYGPAIPSRVGLADIGVVQGLLAVQQLDGWLLYDRDGSNPIAGRLVAPDGHPQRAWFYMIPARGEPVALVHTSEARNFEHLKGKKLVYLGYRDLAKQLQVVLKGVKSIAAEYSPKAAVPNVSRVDAGTLEMIRAAGVNVRSSDTLVQYTKAIWGDAGRTAHYVAVHHITEMRKEALALVAKRMNVHAPVTEYEIQQQIMHSMQIRGLVGPPAVVAAGANTADPYYVPTAAKTTQIQPGDLLVLSIAAKVDKPEGIYAAQTWVAVVDKTVPDRVRQAFATVSLARDQAIVLIKDRMTKHRPVSGAEVDQSTRAFIKKAGVGDQVMHRTGHSIDSDLQGGGADLDDFEVKDTRSLVPGTGFTVGPGLYFPGQFGLRSEVSVYLSPSGPEVTTPPQDEVEPLLK